MEIVSGNKLQAIFHDHWAIVFTKHKDNIRPAIINNVTKMLACRSSNMGFHQYICPQCEHTVVVHHSCKSRFCSSCGKKATDNWIAKNSSMLPTTTWQHITFTMPSQFWEFFWLNRHLFSFIPAIAAKTIIAIAKKKHAIPGIFLAIHTFSRDIDRNVHIHLSATNGGISQDLTKWIPIFYHHQALKNMWKYGIINLFREQYKKGSLKLPKTLNHIKTYSSFNSWLNFHYHKKWVVHLQKPSSNHRINIDYIGKYLKRPPIGETRIKGYDGNNVTFEYLDHYENAKKTMTLSAQEFITRLISHIPDRYFRVIRYFGFLANRIRAKLLPIIYGFLATIPTIKNPFSWRDLIIISMHYDPLLCPNCHNHLQLSCVVFANNDFSSLHEALINKK
jgi:hypothetical protein